MRNISLAAEVAREHTSVRDDDHEINQVLTTFKFHGKYSVMGNFILCLRGEVEYLRN